MEAIWVILGGVVLIGLVLVVIYNRLVALRQQCNQAFADIDVQLRQRRDLIPNLVETVKGYAAHEKSTLDAVISARNAAASANGVAEKAQAESLLGASLGRLFALAEAYPDLKANTNFLKLQEELSNVEDKLSAARRFYNSATADYNAAVEQFPAVLFAGGFGFSNREFFDLGDEVREALNEPVAVKF
jgi:LemA protein